MNERIRELAQQAHFHSDQIWLDQDRFEKFAQLIAKECMEQVWYSREDVINSNISEVIKDRIKQHFGVDK